jgi:hypothetical protein
MTLTLLAESERSPDRKTVANFSDSGGRQTGAAKGHYLHPELFGATEKEAIGATSPPAMTLPATAANANQANLR